MTQPRIYSTLKPPPVETLVVAYLTPLLAPLRVQTRMPQNSPTATTPAANTFIQVESGAGTQISDSIFYDCNIIIQSYAPFDEEITAEDNIGTALAWAGNAQGGAITDSTGYEWFVTYSKVTALAHRNTDPLVPVTKYRGAFLWRIPGQVIAPISAGN